QDFGSLTNFVIAKSVVEGTLSAKSRNTEKVPLVNKFSLHSIYQRTKIIDEPHFLKGTCADYETSATILSNISPTVQPCAKACCGKMLASDIPGIVFASKNMNVSPTKI
ncbi:MAG: hypothetical protein ACI9LN_003821, partial [Saprospiraceae bacterium]